MKNYKSLKDSKAPAAVRMVAILDLIAEKGDASFLEISSSLSIPKSSTHHLLEVLSTTQLLRQRQDGRYVLGLRLFELGGLAIRNRDIRLEAIPFMHELVSLTGLTCHLGILEGNNGFFLSKVESPKAIVKASWEGKRIVFNRMAVGKILLAWLPAKRIDQILSECDFDAKTANTITSKKELIEHLVQVKQKGWAVDNGEDIDEICCMAAPIFNMQKEVIAALGITGTLSQYANSKKQHNLKSLITISQKITDVINFGCTR